MQTTFEYVASGVAHTYIMSNPFCQTPEVVDFVNEIFSKLNGKHNSKFSLLYNAFTEPRFGPKLNQHYKKSLYQIHSDSGGLQIITLGKKITPELYREIYTVQGQYSDIAMSFDEIPVIVKGEKSVIGNTTGRFFDKTKLVEFATLSGKNLLEQIETFIELGSECRPFLIAHGNCRETYLEWIDIMYKQIPAHLHNRIGGIAISGAALGRGMMEDIQKAFITNDFLDYNNHIHILGVGSIKRLIPYLALIQKGYYKKNFHLSYDSTSQTSAISRGCIYNKGKMVRHGKVMNREYEHTFNVLDREIEITKYGVDIPFLLETMMKKGTNAFINNDSTYDVEKLLKYASVILGWLYLSVNDITDIVNKCSTDKNSLFQYAESFDISRETKVITELDNYDEFEDWKNNHHHYVESKRIRHVDYDTLEDLF